MKDIKMKPKSKAPRVMSKAARAPKELARKAALSTKDNMQDAAEHGGNDYEKPEEYASNTVQRTGEDAVHHGKDGLKNQTNRMVRNIRDKQTSSAQAKPKTIQQLVKERRKAMAKKSRQTAQQAMRKGFAAKGATPSAQKAVASTKQTVKRSARRTIKTAQRSAKAAKAAVKTGGRAIKTTAHVAKTTAKTARATAQAAARALQMAKAAAKAAATAIKIMIKAIMAAVKAIIAAMKALITFIAAGGWVVVLIIIIVAIIAMIAGSAFGVFFSDEETTNTMTISQAADEIQADFSAEIQAEIDALAAQDSYEEVKIIYTGDGDDIVSNWADIITIYAAKYMGEDMDVITFDKERKDFLREVFDVMCQYTITHEVRAEEQPPDESPNLSPTPGYGYGSSPSPSDPLSEVTKTLIVTVAISSMDYKEGGDYYDFNDEQREIADEMMSPAYYDLFAELLGTSLYGDIDLPTIIGNLPPGELGSAIAEAALKYVGMPYSQDAGKRGSTHVDCSLLVKWAYRDAGIEIPDVSENQAIFCKQNNKLVSLDALQPGDVVFWQKTTCHCGRMDEVHHVGIYLGNGQVCEASFGKGRVVVGNLWETSKWKMIYAARPHV